MYKIAEVIHLGETILKIKPTALPLGTSQFFSMITTALRCQTKSGGGEEGDIKAAATFSEASTLYMVSKIQKTNNQYHSRKLH